MALQSKLRVLIDAVETNPYDFGDAVFTMAYGAALEFADGSGVGQANRVFADERTVASGAVDQIDLAAGAGNTRPLGSLLTITQIVGLIIINKPKAADAVQNSTALTIGAGANPITGLFGASAHTLILPVGGFLAVGGAGAAGIGTVTPTTGDMLTVTNAAGAANTYQVIVIGRQ